MQTNQFLRRVSFAIPIALVALLLASPTGAQTNYYSAYYTLNPVTQGYIEASGVLHLNGDDSLSQVSLPFPFTFYGVTYPQFHPVHVSTNGYINFLAGNSAYSNECLPSGASPNGAIYAFWDDLYVDGLASMHTEVLGAAPNRQFVIEWRNVRFYGDENRRLSFEIVLSETGEITIQYLGINDDFRERGGGATIGVETTDGVYAYQFSCDRATIGSAEFPLGSTSFAIQFSHSSTVAVDIKPGACPNPFNPGSKGVLPVAILGTANFDVRTIDPRTVSLAGVPPLRSSYEDVGTPAPANECNTLGPDGHMDMTLKFDTEAVVAALGLDTANDGQQLVLSLTGTLRPGTQQTGTQQTGTQQTGTPISGQDKVIIKKGK